MTHRGARRLREERQRLIDTLSSEVLLLDDNDIEPITDEDDEDDVWEHDGTINLDAEGCLEELLERIAPDEDRASRKSLGAAIPVPHDARPPTIIGRPPSRASSRTRRAPSRAKSQSRPPARDAQVRIVRGRPEHPPRANLRPGVVLEGRSVRREVDGLLDDMMRLIHGPEDDPLMTPPPQMDPHRRR
jgi:hypothetical protein